jgi:hypothetical protein
MIWLVISGVAAVALVVTDGVYHAGWNRGPRVVIPLFSTEGDE